LGGSGGVAAEESRWRGVGRVRLAGGIVAGGGICTVSQTGGAG
jgi:hypothetical protein